VREEERRELSVTYSRTKKTEQSLNHFYQRIYNWDNVSHPVATGNVLTGSVAVKDAEEEGRG
jgi:hypothetical protein